VIAPASDTKGVPFQTTAQPSVVANPGCTPSQIRFFATLLTACGTPFAAPPKVSRSPGAAPSCV